MTTRQVLENEKQCVIRNITGCDRKCNKCDLVLPDEEILHAYDEAIDLQQKKESGHLLELPYGVGENVFYVDYPAGFNQMQIFEKYINSIAQAIDVAFSHKKYFPTYAQAKLYLDQLYGDK